MQLRKLRNRTPALAELGERHMQCHATFNYNFVLYIMKCVAGMLKRDKQTLVKRVTDLETAMDQQVNKIKVQCSFI